MVLAVHPSRGIDETSSCTSTGSKRPLILTAPIARNEKRSQTTAWIKRGLRISEKELRIMLRREGVEPVAVLRYGGKLVWSRKATDPILWLRRCVLTG